MSPEIPTQSPDSFAGGRSARREANPFADIGFTTVSIEGHTLRPSICASENDYYQFLRIKYGDQIPRDPKKLRYHPDGGHSINSSLTYSDGMYAPGAYSAGQAPYLVVHFAGTTRTDWRDTYSEATLAAGHIPTWLGTIDRDMFNTHVDFIGIGMMFYVFGADVMAFNPDQAGKYSHMEVALAEALGIPVYTIGTQQPKDLIREIHERHYPRRNFPQPTPQVFEIAQEYLNTNPMETKNLSWNQLQLMNRFPALFLGQATSIYARRGCCMPWESNRSITISPPPNGYPNHYILNSSMNE